jgi:Carboxypeptidase regulatory-like domain
MVVRRSAWRFASVLSAAVGLASQATPETANFITITGTVTDVTTGRPVVGAEINVKYSGQTVGSATSERDGVYHVPFTLPTARPPGAFVTVSASSPRHDPKGWPVQLQTNSPLATQDIELFPLGLSACVTKDHAFIVGHFPSPANRNVSELSKRVADSLHFALRTELQKQSTLKLQRPPSFPSCEAANPSEVRLGAAFAKALGAHAFITGEIAENAPQFLMTIYVSDAYELFSEPELGKDIPINLDRPSEARMPGQTHVAILAALAAGLKEKDDCSNALTVIQIIEQLIGSVPNYLEPLQKECRARVPHAGLVRTNQ